MAKNIDNTDIVQYRNVCDVNLLNSNLAAPPAKLETASEQNVIWQSRLPN